MNGQLDLEEIPQFFPPVEFDNAYCQLQQSQFCDQILEEIRKLNSDIGFARGLFQSILWTPNFMIFFLFPGKIGETVKTATKDTVFQIAMRRDASKLHAIRLLVTDRKRQIVLICQWLFDAF